VVGSQKRPGQKGAWLTATQERADFREAQLTLRASIGKYAPPCTADPEVWAEEPGTDRETRAEALGRIGRAVAGCATCPWLGECRALAVTIDPWNPELRGVVGGRLVGYHGAVARFVADELGLPDPLFL
jgi:hypothetical protein